MSIRGLQNGLERAALAKPRGRRLGNSWPLMVFQVTVLVLGLAVAKSQADVVELNNGQRVEGAFKQATPLGVVIEVGGQTIRFDVAKVRAIYLGAPPASAAPTARPSERWVLWQTPAGAAIPTILKREPDWLRPEPENTYESEAGCNKARLARTGERAKRLREIDKDNHWTVTQKPDDPRGPLAAVVIHDPSTGQEGIYFARCWPVGVTPH